MTTLDDFPTAADMREKSLAHKNDDIADEISDALSRIKNAAEHGEFSVLYLSDASCGRLDRVKSFLRNKGYTCDTDYTGQLNQIMITWEHPQ